MPQSSVRQEMGWGLVGGVFVVGVLALFILGGRLCSSPRTRAGAAPTSVRTERGSMVPGDDCIIISRSGEKAIVGATLADWERFQQLARAQDKLGYSGMLVEGRLLVIEPGTRGKVIALHGWSGLREVRVHDGQHAGRAVYVADHNLRPSR